MYEICDYVRKDGTQCGGLYNPDTNPPIPCIFPEEEVNRLIEEIANLEPVPSL